MKQRLFGYGETKSAQMDTQPDLTAKHSSIRQIESNESLRVVIRVRPPMAREIKDGKFISTVQNINMLGTSDSQK